jgi:hypothetical protein
MLHQDRIENEITEDQWQSMRENFKMDAKLALGDLRAIVNRHIDQTFEMKEWDALAPIVRQQPELERIINASGPRTGWTRNPTPLFETLIKTVAELNTTEFNEMLEELDNLRKRAEEILAVP